ncbi:MAG: hypothetical protein QXX30_03415 [Candidatus Aenigmatarchaeota archaeon]
MDQNYLSGQIHTFSLVNISNDCTIQYNFFSLRDFDVLQAGTIVITEQYHGQGINNPNNLSGYYFTNNFNEFLYLSGQCEKTFRFSYLNHSEQGFIYSFSYENQENPSRFHRYPICFNCSIRTFPLLGRKSFCFPVQIEEYPDMFIVDLNFSYPITIESKEKLYFTAEGVPEGTNIVKRMFDNLPNYFASFFEIFNEEDIEK